MAKWQAGFDLFSELLGYKCKDCCVVTVDQTVDGVSITDDGEEIESRRNNKTQLIELDTL